MTSIGDIINNIYAGRFIGQTNEGKTQFIILTHDFSHTPTKETKNQYSQTTCFLTIDIALFFLFNLPPPLCGMIKSYWCWCSKPDQWPQIS